MSSSMTKLEFPLEPYMLFRIEKTSTYMMLAFALSFVKLCDPYERFVILLKSRSRTWDPKMFYSYTEGEHKNMLVRFSIYQINAPSSCCYILKVLLQKRGMGYAKVIHKKRREKKERKKSGERNEQVSEISKTIGI